MTEAVRLLTGASGFLGAAVARRWLAAGRRVHAFVRDPRAPSGFDLGRAEVHAGDLCDEEAVDGAVAALAADARARRAPAEVVHAGALISYRRRDAESSRLTNVRGTRHVVEACVRHGVQRIVHVSSTVAVGCAQSARETLDEDAPFNGAGLRCAYVTTKRAAEDYALAAAPELEVVVVNPGAVYGPSHRPTNGHRFLAAVRRGYRLPLAPPGSVAVVGVGDVADGIDRALERGRDRRRYLLTESNWTVLGLLRFLAEAQGVACGARARVPRPLWRAAVAGAGLWDRLRPGAVVTPESLALLGVHFRFDARRARDELGWRPRPFAEVVDATLSSGLPPGT